VTVVTFGVDVEGVESRLADLLWADIKSPVARHLLSNAVNLFANQGYSATTTRDVAVGAGKSVGAMYVHFKSKADVLFTISEIGHRSAYAVIRTAAERFDDHGRQLVSVVSSLGEWHATYHQVARVIQYEYTHLTDVQLATIVAMRRETEMFVRTIALSGVSDGSISIATSPSTVTRALLSMCIDVSRWYGISARASPSSLGYQYGRIAAQLIGRTDLLTKAPAATEDALIPDFTEDVREHVRMDST
jgi:AcrR family transcriptional regulator